MINTGEWEDVKAVEPTQTQERFSRAWPFIRRRGLCKDYREWMHRLVPVGFTRWSSSPSFPCSGPLEELPLPRLCVEIPSVCASVSVLLLATHRVLLLSFMRLLAFISCVINWIIDMDQLERNQIFCHLRLCSGPRPCRSHTYTTAILEQIKVRTLFLSGG